VLELWRDRTLGCYTVKKAGMSLNKLSLGGNNDVKYKLFPPRESLVNDIPAEDGNIEKLFLRCNLEWKTIGSGLLHW
jgi:hypothetical protein